MSNSRVFLMNHSANSHSSLCGVKFGSKLNDSLRRQ